MGDGPAVLIPSVMIRTCFLERGDARTARLAMLRVFPSGVFPAGFENRFAHSSRAARSKGPIGTASRALSAWKTKRAV